MGNKERNSQKHGIYSQKPPLFHDPDRNIFEETIARLTAQFAPLSFTDELFIENIAMARVRLQRLWRYQSALIESKRLQRPTLEMNLYDVEKRLVDDDLETLLLAPGQLEQYQRIALVRKEKQKATLMRLEPFQDDLQGGLGEKELERLLKEESHLNKIMEKNLKALMEPKEKAVEAIDVQPLG